MQIVASRSMCNQPPEHGAAPAAHAFSRAYARAAWMSGRCAASTRESTNRHAVVLDATEPC